MLYYIIEFKAKKYLPHFTTFYHIVNKFL